MEQIRPDGSIITLVHYTYQDAKMKWRIACMPNMDDSEFGETPYHKPHTRSNDLRAVTCPMCKKINRER